MMLSAAVLTVDRAKNLTDWKNVLIYSGASKLYIEDITDDFCEDYIMPCVQAGAVYENKYLLGTSMARPGYCSEAG